MVECLECAADIRLENPVLREIVTCAECGSEFEVVSLEPLKIEAAELKGEDWGE